MRQPVRPLGVLCLSAVLSISFAATWGSAAPVQGGDSSQERKPGADRVSAGFNNTCALQGGTVWCWGNNSAGQSGDGTTTSHSTPVPVVGLHGVSAITVGEVHTCAIMEGGLWCWGYNHDGELGIGTTADSWIPVAVPGMESGIKTVSAGWFHTCAVKDGGAWCWGFNNPGTIGNASVGLQTSVPVPVDGMTSGVTAISAGEFNTCAIKDGGAWCWGEHSTGQLGDGSSLTPVNPGHGIQSRVPVPVSGLERGVTGISAGEFQICAVKDGGVWCWGYNYNGETDDPGTVSNVPVAIQGLSSGVTAVSVGTNHSCALKDGGAWCWGRGEQGQLGDGSRGNTVRDYTPKPAQGMENGVTSVSAGENYTCAVRGTDTSCWGDNYLGQLGDGTQQDRPRPVAIPFVVPSPEHPPGPVVNPFLPPVAPAAGTGPASARPVRQLFGISIALLAAGVAIVSVGRHRAR